jgi:putative YhdH/YhfP family quinone oxidoreductase
MSKALLATNTDGYRVSLTDVPDSDLKGDVLIDVAYSSLNYKDALAVTGRGKIVRRFPMVLGIDLAGTVVESSSPDFKAGERVLAVGQGLGETEWGGYAQRQRVSAGALVPLPDGMSLEQSMQIGTAGFTAMLCVLALVRNNVQPGEREVIVTGAAGGVGSVAVMILAGRGYGVAASTGRTELEPYLRELGATSIVPRDELAKPGAPMQSERWAGGVDSVGGTTLANVFAQTSYGGAVASCGMAGGHELQTTVWPLILRNVSLLGVSSIRTPKRERIEAWTALARELDERKLAVLARTEPLTRIHELSEQILGGKVKGRIVIDVNR